MQTKSAYSPTLTEADAAHYLGVSRAFLTASRLRERRTDGPPFVKIGRAVRYLQTDLDAFLEARRITPAA
jgi:hypothetical protein